MAYLDESYNIEIEPVISDSSNYRQDIIASGTGTIGILTGVDLTTRYMIRNKPMQIRQNGPILSISFAINSLTNVNEIVVEFWTREKAETTGTWPYYKVAETQNLLPFLSTGINTVGYQNLTADGSYIVVSEGTTLVLRIGADTIPCSPFYYDGSITNAELREYSGSTPPNPSSFDWKAQTVTSTTTIRVEVTQPNPKMLFFGDSIISGVHENSSPLHCSYACNTIDGAFSRSPDIEWHIKTIPYKLAELLGLNEWQNLGVNSNRTTQITQRLPTDVNNCLPDLVVIEGGTNDLNGGVGWGTVSANLTTMFEALKLQSNIVIYLGIFPRSDIDDTKAGTRRTWNDSIQTLVGTYNIDNNFHFIDLDSVLGQIRVSTGELDDLKDEYDCGDGVHLNDAGCQVVAQSVYNYLVNNDLIKWIG